MQASQAGRPAGKLLPGPCSGGVVVVCVPSLTPVCTVATTTTYMELLYM
jgi:hypothetical protein